MHETTRETRAYGPAAGRLCLPMQAAPVDRTPSGVALAAGSGVEAAGLWDSIKTGAGIAGKIGDMFF